MIGILMGVAICLLYVVASICCGGAVTRILTGSGGLASLTPAGRAASSFVVGQGVLACVWLAISLAGWFTFSVVIGVLVFLAIVGVITARGCCVGLTSQIRSWFSSVWKLGAFWRIVSLLIAVQFAFLFLITFLPPYGDAALYYMVLPKLQAHLGRLAPLPGYEVFMQMGQHGEMHFAVLMLLGQAGVAKLIVWFNVVASAVMLVELCAAARLTGRGMLLAATMMLTSTAMTYVAVDGKVDMFSTSLGLCGIFWAMQVGGGRLVAPVAMAGLLAGCAVVAKLSYAVTLVPAIAIIIAWRVLVEIGPTFGEKFRRIVGAMFWLGVFMLPAILLHVAKNWALFNAPLAPFIAPDSGWKNLHNPRMDGPAINSWVDWVHLTIVYPIIPFFGRYLSQYGNLSMLIAAMLPLALIIPRRGPLRESPLFMLSLAAAAAMVLYTVMFPFGIQTRNYLAIGLVLAIPAAAGAEAVFLVGRERLLKFIVGAAVLAAIGAILAYETPLAVKSANFAAGRTSAEQIVAGPLQAAQVANKLASAENRVVAGYDMWYWLAPEVIANSCNAGEKKRLAAVADMKHRWATLADMKFRYIVLDEINHIQPTDAPNAGCFQISSNQDLVKVYLDPRQLPQGITLEKIPPIYESFGTPVARIQIYEIKDNRTSQ